MGDQVAKENYIMFIVLFSNSFLVWFWPAVGAIKFFYPLQEMINSWTVPFVEAFSKSKDVHLYQVIMCLVQVICISLSLIMTY